MEPSGNASAEGLAPVPESEDDVDAKESKSSFQIDLPTLSQGTPHAWNEVNEKQLRSALIGACKRMPRNAEAHFHLGLMYMRKCDGEEALRSFQHCKQIYNERLEQHTTAGTQAPPQLLSSIARLRSHTAQAAHMAAAATLGREERAPLLERLQRDLVAATNMDNSQPDVWNALALLHLTEGGEEGARDVLRSIRTSFPDYLDALNNLGLSELALGNEEAAISCFQKVILCDREHAEALSNYGVVLLRHGMYDAAIRTFETAVHGSAPDGRGLSFAWGGLAIARGAVGLLDGAQEAAREAERTADSLNRSRFAMLMTSIQARSVTDELRRGLKSEDGRAKEGQTQETRLGTSDVQMVDGNGSSERTEVGRVMRDPRPAIDSAVLKLRALARDIKSSSASTALGAVLRIRHEYSWEESGNRNFGAEAAERLVEALEKDDGDGPAWVQLALLQMGTGEYSSARDFAVQAVSRCTSMESGWNALAVASQLNDEIAEAVKSYEKGIEVVRLNYNKNRNRGLGDNATDREEEGILFGCGEESEGGEEELNEAGLKALAALYNNIGNMKRQEGRSFSEALAAFEKSLKFGGENAVVYNNLALLYISAGRFDDALSMLNHALKLDPLFECAISNHLKLLALIRKKDRSEPEDEEDASDGFAIDDNL